MIPQQIYDIITFETSNVKVVAMQRALRGIVALQHIRGQPVPEESEEQDKMPARTTREGTRDQRRLSADTLGSKMPWPQNGTSVR